MRFWGIIAFVAIAAAAWISAFNAERISLVLWPGADASIGVTAPLPLFLIAAFAFGAVGGALSVWLAGEGQRRRLRQSQAARPPSGSTPL